MERSTLLYGIIFDRFIHEGQNPDELGTVKEWNNLIQQLRILAPVGGLVENFKLEMWHMSDPRLDAERRANIANLEDYDTITAGCQVAAGLCFGTDRIEIGQFPQVWKHDINTYAPIAAGQLNQAMGVLSHELGHRWAAYCSMADGSQEAQQLWALFDRLRPFQTQSQGEDFAEVYRALHGATAGTFSDGKEYKNPPTHLRLFMKFLLDIRREMTGTIIDVAHGYDAATGDIIYWREYEKQWWWPWPRDEWKAISHNGQRYKWASGKWVKF